MVRRDDGGSDHCDERGAAVSRGMRVEVAMSEELLRRAEAFRTEMERTGQHFDRRYRASLSNAICVAVVRQPDERGRTVRRCDGQPCGARVDEM